LQSLVEFVKYLVIAQECRYTDDIAGRSRGAMVIPSSGADKRHAAAGRRDSGLVLRRSVC
jgi:hypothetical protein